MPHSPNGSLHNNHASAASSEVSTSRSGPFLSPRPPTPSAGELPFLVDPPHPSSADLFFTLGRLFFALSLLAFGVQEFQYRGHIGDLGLVPAWFPARLHLIAAWGAGAFLLFAGLAILVRHGARLTTFILGVVFLVSAFLRFPPQHAAILHGVVDRTVFFHLLSCAGGSWILTRLFTQPSQLSLSLTDSLAAAGRLLFALSVIVYGLDHFQVAAFIALLIPHWIPFHAFFAWFTGCALVGAGLAMATRVCIRPAAALLALMFFLWTLIIQVPGVIHAPHDSDAWNSVFIPIAMSGCALLVAALPTHTRPRDSAHRPA